ncbi:MAG TPA: hypothetical protein PK822_08940, partial [Bacillota bacterium]|nr:hypothetical protein [Bacillota bacterium]
VGKYLELLGAVNAAATNSQMVEALKGLEYYTDYVDQWDVFADYVGEDYYTQLTIAENILLKVPFETIAEIASALASAPEEIEPEL